MSTLAYATAAPAERPRVRPAREKPLRRVEIVSTRKQRRARPRPVYAIVTIGGLFGLFVAQLLMSIAISDGAYQISALQGERAALERTEVALTEQVDTLASTQNLAAKASELGMVLGSTTPAFLDVTTGKVVGKTKDIPVASSTLGIGLVSNALLPDESADPAGAAAAADPATTGAALPTETQTETEIEDGGVTGGSTALPGAPTPSSASGSLTSQSGLPVPVTR